MMRSLNVLHLTYFASEINSQHKILQVEFNDAKNKNALSYEFIDDLHVLKNIINEDQTISCIIFTGANGMFCPGGNVKDMAQQKGFFAGTPEEISQSYQNYIQQIPLILQSIEIPIIAAINGPAVGAGFDISLMCDIRLAAENAYFTENFVRIGLISGDGGLWFLARVIGLANASYYALTGEKISAARAKELGIITEITTAEELLSRAQTIAQTIAACSSSAIKATKILLRTCMNDSLADFLPKVAAIQGQLHHSPEHQAAIKILMERFKKKNI